MTSVALASAAVLAASLVLGGATAFAQAFLPEWFVSFANSASGWTVITAALVISPPCRRSVTGALVYGARVPWWLSAALGAVSFVLLTVGYAIVSTMRGYAYDPLMFSVIGLVVGPFVGVAACWLRARGLRAALGTAALAGVGMGEAAYGLTVVGETTSPVYWIVIGIIGVVLLGVMLWGRIRGALPVVVAVGGTAVVAVAFVAAYSMVGLI